MTQLKFQTIPFGGLLNQLAQTAIHEIAHNRTEIGKNPALNVLETTDGFELQIAAPGFQKSEFTIELKADILTVSAKKESKNVENSEKWLRREFTTSEFNRSLKLPESVDANQIGATLEQGILTLLLVKKETAKPIVKSIQVI